MWMDRPRLEAPALPRVAHGRQPTSSTAAGSGRGDRRRAWRSLP
jgi:hypothetical protein